MSRPWSLWVLGGIIAVGLLLPIAQTLAQRAQDEPLSRSPFLRIDPDSILHDEDDPPSACGGCHGLEYESWLETKHATGFDELHRRKYEDGRRPAQQILRNMGLTQAKSESLCLKCHYTAKDIEGEIRAIAGVSCESCHGAAKGWRPFHNDYGAEGASVAERRENETEAHREARIDSSIANGMLRPSSDLYAVAANCFECHTVPEEELVNRGGHSPGSSNFELIDQIDEIRHNFLPSQWGGGNENRESSPGRKRMMYVLGRALDYEYNIRGIAEATETGSDKPYFKVMEGRTKAALSELSVILRTANIPEIAEVVRIGRAADLQPNNEAELLAAADEMRDHAQRFARNNDGSTLGALDALIFDGNAVGGNGGLALVADVEGNEYEKRTRPEWFPVMSARVETVPACGCHRTDRDGNPNDEYAWLESDRHSRTAQLLEGSRAEGIAELYGLSAEDMRKGGQICMSCHGTAAAGQADIEIEASVTCQSCHGAAEFYQNAHDPGGYEVGAPHGMARLEMPSIRAETCARCHLITDERLLAAGHSDGGSFDLTERNEALSEHWVGPDLAPATLAAEYEEIVAARPIPEVERVRRSRTPTLTVPVAPANPNSPAAATDEAAEEGASGPPSAANTPPPAAANVQGERRARPAWFAANLNARIDPNPGCEGCHGTRDGNNIDEGARYFNGPHSGTVFPLLVNPQTNQPTERALAMIRNYGLSPQQMLSGEQLCMNCHGTVEPDGFATQAVTCQSCHGGAADYLGSHRNGGYEAGAGDGMTQLETASVRAETCARCHLITDERLISAGHKTGEDFQIGARNGQVVHWAEETANSGALESAYSGVFNARPIPSVRKADLPPEQPITRQRRSASAGSAGSAGAPGGNRAVLPPLPSPRPGLATGGAPLPPSDTPNADSLSTEDLLLHVKERLETLYRSLRRDGQ